MEILMLSIYGALCWVVFKVFHIPLNKWTLPTAALGRDRRALLHPADHELQPSVHQGSQDLLLYDADRAGRAGDGEAASGPVVAGPRTTGTIGVV